MQFGREIIGALTQARIQTRAALGFLYDEKETTPDDDTLGRLLGRPRSLKHQVIQSSITDLNGVKATLKSIRERIERCQPKRQ